MLGKLLKYEFKSLMNNLGVLYLVWLISHFDNCCFTKGIEIHI